MNALGCRVYCAFGVFGAIVAGVSGLWWLGLPLAFLAGCLFENAIVQRQLSGSNQPTRSQGASE